MEQTNIDYNGSGRSRAMSQRKHDVVRVPLTGVREIWADKRAKGTTASLSGSAAPATKPKLPSDGSHPAAPPPDAAAHAD
jgi:hypothetical protein